MKLMHLSEIKKNLNIQHAVTLQEEGFVLYSKNKVMVPPVGYMNFGKETGEAHIKYGWIEGDPIYVVKIAGAFYQNPLKHELPAIQGIILVFDAVTGQTRAVLQDEGYLTNIRTAMAGLITAKYLSPKKITGIGVLGTGVQAHLQVELLKQHTDCKKLYVWGRNPKSIEQYINDMKAKGFQVKPSPSISELCNSCNLIISTTSAKEPLILSNNIQPGTHITAVGADAPGKQELDPNIFRMADLCVVDSKSQCIDHGETYYAYEAGIIQQTDLIELGELIDNPRLQRKTEDQITIADLTGVSVQDIQIAKAVFQSGIS